MFVAALKSWELEDEEDFFNMFLILTLSETTIFLLKPTPTIFFVGASKLLIYFYLLIKIRKYDFSALNFKKIIFLLIPSLALTMILFFAFPRFTKGFMTPSSSMNLTTGHSNSIRFENLGKLNQNNDISFKIYQDQFFLQKLLPEGCEPPVHPSIYCLD